MGKKKLAISDLDRSIESRCVLCGFSMNNRAFLMDMKVLINNTKNKSWYYI